MATTTPNYGLIKPDVNSPTDEDLWGGELNDDMDIIDTTMKSISDVANAASMSLVPIGAVLDYAGTSAPSNFLFCYGQAINRVTYADLFTAIGTTYGVGDGTTTFNLPDCRGRVSAGKDDMGGSSANRLTNSPTGGVDGDVLGGTGGSQGHTLTVAQLALHGHPYRYSGRASAQSDTTGGFMVDAAPGVTTQPAFTGTPSNTTGEQIGGTGSGDAHNNVQPTIIFNKIIKAL